MDGAWWPYSRDAVAELPGLIAAVDQRLGRITLRIGVHPDTWQRIPRRIPARGRQVRVGWSGHTDPRVIVLFFAADEPVALLVIPPGTPAGPAEATLRLTTRDTAGLTADAVRTLACPPPGFDPHETAAGSPARRERKGGAVTGQRAQLSTTRPSAPR